MNPMDTPEYRMSYARNYPLYVMRWEDRKPSECYYAQRDIHATLKACPDADPAYIGKLWAELDAIRDRMMTIYKEQLA